MLLWCVHLSHMDISHLLFPCFLACAARPSAAFLSLPIAKFGTVSIPCFNSCCLSIRLSAIRSSIISAAHVAWQEWSSQVTGTISFGQNIRAWYLQLLPPSLSTTHYASCISQHSRSYRVLIYVLHIVYYILCMIRESFDVLLRITDINQHTLHPIGGGLKVIVFYNDVK